MVRKPVLRSERDVMGCRKDQEPAGRLHSRPYYILSSTLWGAYLPNVQVLTLCCINLRHTNVLPKLHISATEPSITIHPSEFELIDDIINKDTDSCFTDGVGTISPELADEVWTMLRASRRTKTRRIPPSAYQIRIAGCKGVVVRDHTLSGRKICIRKSMNKFHADSMELEIAMSCERPIATHLNRRVI